MKRTPLRRKKPMKRPQWSAKAPPKPRKPLRKVAKARGRQMAEYYLRRNTYLAAHPACGICLVRGHAARPATEVHHSRGRIGKLLCDERYWIPSCRGCREWPHEHPAEARRLGVLAPASLWNVSQDRSDAAIHHAAD